MSASELDQVIESYATRIEALAEQGINSISVLEVLNARDILAAVMKTDCRISTPQLNRVIELDQSLREKASTVNQALKDSLFSQWRDSVSPPPEAWWWHLDNIASIHPLNRFDGLWKLMMIAGWTGNLTLLVNLATKFLGGGVGLTGVAAIALPSILALLQIGSEFTKIGQESLEKLFLALKIPTQLHEEAKLVMTLLFSGALCLTWVHLPQFSQANNLNGVENSKQGKTGEAEQDFLKSIALNPNNVDAHYNLGSLYDRLERSDDAKKEYLNAAAANLPDAFNNIGRLSILDKKYPQAAFYLIQGIKIIDAQAKVDSQVKYNLYKNFGWVRFEQKRYDEAEDNLKTAIGIASTKINASSAHCLLAQVLDKQSLSNKNPSALNEWKQCRKLGKITEPDEDPWLFLANQRLNLSQDKSRNSTK